MTSHAPVALFVYNRPDHTRLTVEALRDNAGAAETDLVVFADGPKTPADAERVAAVRAFARGVTGFKSVRVIERDENRGLAASIIAGVTRMLEEHERVIVMEDDLVTSKYFLTYMNQALAHYAGDERVASVHGYTYPVSGALPETFFLRGADCWGWATWRDRWRMFDPDGARLLRELRTRGLADAFDLGGAFSNTAMLEAQVQGRNNSWAIRWHASAFLADKLTLYPGHSLVLNIGNDSSGTHCGTTDTFDVEFTARPVAVGGIAVEESEAGRRAFAAFGRANELGRQSFGTRAVRALRRLLRPA